MRNPIVTPKRLKAYIGRSQLTIPGLENFQTQMLTWRCALPNVDGKSSVAWAPLTWRTVNGPNHLAVSLKGMSFGVCLESNHTKSLTLSVAGPLRLDNKCPKRAWIVVMWSTASQWRIFIRLEMADSPIIHRIESQWLPQPATTPWPVDWPSLLGKAVGDNLMWIWVYYHTSSTSFFITSC